MSCMHFPLNLRPQDDSTESSDSITYWRKPLDEPRVGGRGSHQMMAELASSIMPPTTLDLGPEVGATHQAATA